MFPMFQEKKLNVWIKSDLFCMYKTFADNDACPHFFVHSFVFKSKNGNIGTSAAKSLILKGKQRSSDLEHDWNTPGTRCISWNSRHYV